MKNTIDYKQNLKDKLFEIKKKRKSFIVPKIDKKTAWATLMDIAKERVNGFVYDQHNKEAFLQLFYYFLRDRENFKGNLRKGLFLIGRYGTGKTEAFEIFRIFLEVWELNQYPYSLYFDTTDTTRIVAEYENEQNGGDSAIMKYKSKKVWVFNDLGKEIKDGNFALHYGKKSNLMERIIADRYISFIENGVVTHATSNYPLESKKGERFFKNFYGDYIDDRMKQMFNVIIFKGSSRRK